jgi:hypothetical protein
MIRETSPQGALGLATAHGLDLRTSIKGIRHIEGPSLRNRCVERETDL